MIASQGAMRFGIKANVESVIADAGEKASKPELHADGRAGKPWTHA
jgi:hypothetical protein